MSNNDIKKKLKVSVEEGAARSNPPIQEDTHNKKNRSLSDTIDALKKAGVLLDKYSHQGDEYEVETVLKASDQDWFFSAVVKYNGEEITDNIELARETFQRKRVTQANKSKALWNLFVKGAAEVHLHKCHAVKRRNEPSGKNLLRSKNRLFSVLGVLIVVGAGTIIYMLDLTPSAINPKTQKNSGIEAPLAEPAMPSNPDLVSIKTIEPVIQPSTDQLAPKSEIAPISEAQVKATEEPDDKLSSESQNPPAITAGTQTTPEVRSDPKVQETPTAESELPTAHDPEKPLVHTKTSPKPTEPPAKKTQEQEVTEPKAPPAAVETQSQKKPESEVQPVPEKQAPTPEVQPTPTKQDAESPEPNTPPAPESQISEETDSINRQTNESDQQQSSTTLSPEEIKKKVKMLLKNN